MNNRVFKNWKSSVLGLVLLVVSCLAMLTGKATMTEFYISLPTIIGFIYVKDSIFNPKSK